MRKPYATKDGYLVVLPYTDNNWQKLFEIADRQYLIDDPRFADLATRNLHSGEIYQILNDIIATHTTANGNMIWDSPMSRCKKSIAKKIF